jgi:biopolymer transport protein ExbD
VIDYGRVMEVVGAIHAAGFTKVALVTEFQEARLPGERDDGPAAD